MKNYTNLRNSLPTKSNKRIDAEIHSLVSSFNIPDKGPLKYYLVTRFDHNSGGSIELTQPRMIQRAVKVFGLDVNDQHVKMYDSPSLSEKLLDNNPNGKLRLQPWHYCSAMGFLSYISEMIHPDITIPFQKCAIFCNNHRQEHEEAMNRICRYLLCVHEKGCNSKTGPHSWSQVLGWCWLGRFLATSIVP